MVKKICFIFLIFLASSNLQSKPVVFHHAEQSFELGNYIDYLEDPSGKLNIEQVSSEPYKQKFKAYGKPRPNFGYTKSSYWVRFHINNQSRQRLELILELVSLIDKIDLFTQKPNSSYTHIHTGRWEPMTTRPWVHRNFLFPLSIASDEVVVVYMRIQSEGALLFPLSVYTLKAFTMVDHVEQIGFGLYFGIMVVMVLYNLFLYFSIRTPSYIYYVLYISFITLIVAGVWGFGHEYLWGFNMWWANQSLPFFIGGSAFWLMLFAAHFLDTRNKHPYLHRLAMGLAWLSCAQMLLTLVMPYGLSIRLGLAAGFLGAIVAFTISLISFIKGYRPARYFFIAFLVMIFGTIIAIFRTLGILPFNFYTNYSILVGSAMEVILLSLALADRINILQIEKVQIQDQALNLQKLLTDAFARFVPEEFLKLLGKKSIIQLKLGDQISSNMTVLFSDIRSFTTLSEQMNPDENFEFLNSYLGDIGPCIQRNGGFIDKYIGDAIMAIFPKTADQALKSAIDIFSTLDRFNEQRSQKNQTSIQIGIGIHTGLLILGTIGTNKRMQSTVISDAVNLASRLEGLTKRFRSKILISKETKNQLSNADDFNFRYLGKVKIRGKHNHVEIFEICDADPIQQMQLKLESIPKFEQAINLYFKQEFDDAASVFKEIISDNPDDGAAICYLQQCNDKIVS